MTVQYNHFTASRTKLWGKKMVKRKRKDQTTSSKSSSFFIIFKVSEENQFLQEIPPEFVTNVLTKKQVPDQFLLECSSRGSWPVRVIQSENGVFLKNGWRKFVEDNSLQELDLILFTYRGTSQLVYQIFDKSGLEITTSTSRTDEAKDRCKPKSKEERARIFMSQSQNYLFERSMKVYNVSKPFILYIPQDFGVAHFPPQYFGVAHFPPHKTVATVATVENADGKAWEVNCASNGKNFRFIGGWVAFARENHLEIGDICVFELVAELTLRVHVFSDV